MCIVHIPTYRAMHTAQIPSDSMSSRPHTSHTVRPLHQTHHTPSDPTVTSSTYTTHRPLYLDTPYTHRSHSHLHLTHTMHILTPPCTPTHIHKALTPAPTHPCSSHKSACTLLSRTFTLALTSYTNKVSVLSYNI